MRCSALYRQLHKRYCCTKPTDSSIEAIHRVHEILLFDTFLILHVSSKATTEYIYIYIFSRKPLYKNTSSRGFLICMGGAEGENYSKLCKGASPRHVSSQIVIHIERKRALYRLPRQRLCVLQCGAVCYSVLLYFASALDHVSY